MTSPRNPTDLRAALRSLHDFYEQVPLPGELETGVRAAPIQPRASSLRLVLVCAGGLAVATAILLLVVLTRSRPPAPRTPEPAAGFAVLRRSPDFRGTLTPDQLEVTGGSGVFVEVESGARVSAGPGAHLRREGRRPRLLRGRIDVEVTPRPDHAVRFELAVSHGLIRVIGTRFSVEQEVSGGAVSVERGKVQVVLTDGAAPLVGAGHSYRWGAARRPPASESGAEVAPDAETAPPKAGVPHRPGPRALVRAQHRCPGLTETLDQALAALDQLRIQKRFAAMPRRIARLLPCVDDPKLRQSLAYERCDLLANRLSRAREACSCFGSSRRFLQEAWYRARAEAARKQLRCDDEVP